MQRKRASRQVGAISLVKTSGAFAPTKKPIHQWVAFILSSGMLFSGATFAQEATKADEKATPSSSRLETVTVTAQKREESAQDVATTINVLSANKLLEENIGKSSQEVLNYVANASAYGSQHGRPRWWIRGIGAGNQQGDSPNPVGTYLDDVYISNASASGFPLFDQERVEILSGPQGTLWGKNTTGGAVNFVSKKPSFKTDGYVKGSYGTWDDKVIEAAYGGSVVEDTIAARVSFHQEDQGPRYNNTAKGGKEGELKDTAIRGQILAVISPDLEVNLNLHAREYTTKGSTSQSIGTGPNGAYLRNAAGVALFTPSTNVNDIYSPFGNALNWSDTQQNGINLTANYQWGRNALTSITGYEDYAVESSSAPSTPFTTSTPSFTRTGYKERQFSQEFRLASPKEDQLSWIGGLYFFTDEITSNTKGANLAGYTVYDPATGNTSASSNSLTVNGYSHKTLSRAIFGSATYNFNERLDTTVGWRWSREAKSYQVWRQSYTGSNFGGVTNGWYDNIVSNGTAAALGATNYNPTGLSKSWDAVTYDFTPTYKLNATDRVYYKYAHGIKSGGFNTAVTNLNQIYSVDPEVLDNHEVGYKSEWADGRLIFNASVFTYKIKNYQVNVSGPYGAAGVSATVLGNVDQAHAQGAEFSVQALPTERLRINANIGFLRTRFDNFVSHVPFANFDFSGNQFVRSPNVNALLQADYRIPVSTGGSVVLGGDVKFTGKQYYYVNFQDVAENGQGAYSLFNARLSYNTANNKDTISFYVKNLLDKKYTAHSGIVNQTSFQTGWGTTWGEPRTVGVSYLARF